MGDITYEQFEAWCKYWNITLEEGYRAICFVSNIIDQYCGNCINYESEIVNDDNHSEAFKSLVKMKNEDVIRLKFLYRDLDIGIFKMLRDHDEEANT